MNMDETPSLSNTVSSESDAEQSRRWRFQFSLRSLLVFFLFVAMTISSLVMYWRMTKAEEESAYLRSIAGHLKIDDDSLFYAIALDSTEPNTWRWRVYIPKHREIIWHMDHCTISSDDQSAGDQGFGEQYWEGEAEITLSLKKGQNNKFIMVLTYRSPNSTRIIDESSIRTEFIKDVEKKMKETERIGSNGAETRKPGEEIVFLKKRLVSTGTKATSKNPEPGITLSLRIKP